MTCRQFRLASEEFLDRHGNPSPGPPPAELQHHITACVTCAGQWERALKSRVLLASLRAPEPPVDPYFMQRLQAHLQAATAAREAIRRPWQLAVGMRQFVAVASIFVVTIAMFVFDMARIERPNVDEAIVLDVPHADALHPADDHLRVDRADVILSLLQR
jgi:hypothetical protein